MFIFYEFRPFCIDNVRVIYRKIRYSKFNSLYFPVLRTRQIPRDILYWGKKCVVWGRIFSSRSVYLATQHPTNFLRKHSVLCEIRTELCAKWRLMFCFKPLNTTSQWQKRNPNVRSITKTTNILKVDQIPKHHVSMDHTFLHPLPSKPHSQIFDTRLQWGKDIGQVLDYTRTARA